MTFRFVPPTDDMPGYVREGDKIVTAQYLTPTQAKSRAQFWARSKELRLLETLRDEATQPERHPNERGA